jgi:hypothetical protein
MSRASNVLTDLRESKCLSRTELCLYLVQTTPDETKWSPEMLRRLEEGRMPLRLAPHIAELRVARQLDAPVFAAAEIDSLVQAIQADEQESAAHEQT